jgi:hypothetical protein
MPAKFWTNFLFFSKILFWGTTRKGLIFAKVRAPSEHILEQARPAGEIMLLS